MVDHDEAFAAFQARRETERAAAETVTWRRLSPAYGGGWIGRGWIGGEPTGDRVYILPRAGGYVYGRVEGNEYLPMSGSEFTPLAAKRAASLLLGPTPEEETR